MKENSQQKHKITIRSSLNSIRTEERSSLIFLTNHIGVLPFDVFRQISLLCGLEVTITTEETFCLTKMPFEMFGQVVACLKSARAMIAAVLPIV